MALEMSFEDNGNNRRVLKRNFWMFRSELMKILCLFIEFNLLFWKLSKFCDLFLCASKTIRFHFHFSFAGKSALVTDLSGMQSGFEMNSDEWIFTQWPHRWRPSGLIEVTNTHLNPSVFEKTSRKVAEFCVRTWIDWWKWKASRRGLKSLLNSFSFRVKLR